ncbi:response regulator [Paenibacillus sp. 2TAB19]|uniref:response regulator transcription factor n=1 Tax=Paenibacillus sp. 2TAB19 TaxID=3233003 RepID=UPI003F98202A
MYRVFIVDDEPFIIEGLYDIIDWGSMDLEIVGHAENGKDALEALAGRPADILITDISMPVMNGLALIRSARESLNADLKVIVLSGFNEFDYLKEGMRLGIENYLLKPINLEELKATLANTISKLNEAKASIDFNKRSIRILRDNVMYRWLMNQIDPAQFGERAELLGIRLDTPYVAIAIISMAHLQRETLDWMATRNESDYGTSIIAFRDMEGDVVVVFKLNEREEGLEQAAQLLRSFRAEWPGKEQPRLSLGSAEKLEDAAHSYAHARKALEYYMIYPDREIVRYDELPSGQGDNQQRFPLDWAEYAQLIMAKEKEELLHRLEDDFAQLQKREGLTPADIRDTGMELAVRLKMQLEEIRHDEETQLFQGSFDQLRQAASLEQVVEMLKEAAGMTVDALIRDVKSPIVQQVLNHVKDAFNEDLSLKKLGAMYNIHPVYLGQLFHKEVNETFTEYMNKYRVEKAKELLKNTTLKVHDIATNVGYWETGYFYKQFKKHVGISPSEYRGLL